ncbi:MAG: SDR family oxidoreductase [Actinomycetota bacterium]|nr:SDR family oxidoreductase [Actinomycetota bacterium]
MLEGKNVLVTGASRGIGRAIALEAGVQGAVVGINYLRNRSGAEDVAARIADTGPHLPVLLEFDATSPREIEGGISLFLEKVPRIDGWVNNAAENYSGLLPVLAEEEIRRQLESALLGPILCCRAVIPRMLEQRGGSIINIGSVVTQRLTRGQSVYAAAKGGLLAFTRALACEYGRKGIRVNCVQPGPVATDMLEASQALAGDEIIRRTPLGRLCRPEEVANAVVYLLGDRSAGVTGACINVDGGYALA